MTEVPPASTPPVQSQPTASQPAKRPGGLTALAVLNFVFGGLGALLLLLAIIGLTAVEAATDGDVNTGLLWVSVLIGVVSVVLLFIAGAGYLKMTKSGYLAGNAYGVMAVIGSIIGIIAGQVFGFGTILGLVYPVLTLILLNTTFRKCFP